MIRLGLGCSDYSWGFSFFDMLNAVLICLFNLL